MLTGLILTHACGEILHWSAGGYFDHKGLAISQCRLCREWLGEPFLRAEEGQIPVPCRRRSPAKAAQTRPSRPHLKSRPQLKAS